MRLNDQPFGVPSLTFAFHLHPQMRAARLPLATADTMPLRYPPSAMTYVDFNGLTIIESLKATEAHTGTELHDELRPLLASTDVSLKLVTAPNRETFLACLSDVRSQAAHQDVAPILHLELHGNQDGLGFTDGTFIAWNELAEDLRSINEVLKNHLVITMAVCDGAYILRTISPMRRAPFFGIVGSFEESDGPVLRAGFRDFYLSFLEHLDFTLARDALKAHLPAFQLRTAADLYRNSYEAYRRQFLTPERVEERIQKIVEATKAKVPEVLAREAARMAIVDGDKPNWAVWWRHFVMADLDPSNLSRCPLTNP